jgi:hypothetical protein
MCDGAPCRPPPRTPFSHKSTFLWREQTRRKVTGSVRQSTPYARRRVRAEERRHTSVRPSHGPEGRRPSPRCPPHRDPVYGDMPEEGGHSRQCQPSGNNLCGSREYADSRGVGAAHDSAPRQSHRLQGVGHHILADFLAHLAPDLGRVAIVEAGVDACQCNLIGDRV